MVNSLKLGAGALFMVQEIRTFRGGSFTGGLGTQRRDCDRTVLEPSANRSNSSCPKAVGALHLAADCTVPSESPLENLKTAIEGSRLELVSEDSTAELVFRSAWDCLLNTRNNRKG